MEVYLDNSATTQVFDSVKDVVIKTMAEEYGNPSAMHRKGIIAERYIKEAKEVLAKSLKVESKEIFFTSGGTESNNMALIGAAMANRRSGSRIITTEIEHPSVKNTMKYLEEQGFELIILPVDKVGKVRLEVLEEVMTPDTILVSVMYVNNEIGSVQPIEEISSIIHTKNPKVAFHVDGVQAFGKYKIYPKRMGIDLFSASGHKIHAPKGVGFLYKNAAVKVKPVVFGGGQQDGMRSGTLNVPGIAGLACATAEVYSDFSQKQERLYQLKEKLVQGLGAIEGVRINGMTGREGAPHIVSAGFLGIRSEVLLHALEDKGIYVSAGSACSAHKASVSPTLKAIGVEKEYLGSVIRFSFSEFTTEKEIQYTLEVIRELLPMLGKYV
ncbi:MAG: cysteine desulfurase [Lachnospiraceae bacterium]|nr:cysteine desulfurase [Lachnospiraceae bacterium]